MADQNPNLTYGLPLAICIECMFAEAADDTNTRIQVGCGYIIVDREECQSMRHVEEETTEGDNRWSR